MLFGFSGKSAISAETYVNSQDMCFRIDITSPEVASWTLKLGVYQHEGGHYTLIGTDGVGAVHGNAEVIGGNVVLTLVSKGTDSEEYLDNASAILNAANLGESGSYHAFFTEVVGGNVVTISESGTMAKINCP